MELPRDTLIEVEIVQELRGEVSDKLVTSPYFFIKISKKAGYENICFDHSESSFGLSCIVSLYRSIA